MDGRQFGTSQEFLAWLCAFFNCIRHNYRAFNQTASDEHCSNIDGHGLDNLFRQRRQAFLYFRHSCRGTSGFALIVYITPYRLDRVLNYINPESNPLGGGYHINQAKIAIGSGGMFGVGYGQSTTKIKYLPEPIGDSIFAVIAEELGFAGSLTLVGAFVLLVTKTLLLARKAPDRFAKLLLIGFASLIAIQAFVNIGAISGLIPLTGTPLPFISYGGTALAVFMTMGGIIANISKYV